MTFRRSLLRILPLVLLTAPLLSAQRTDSKRSQKVEGDDHFKTWLKQDVIYIITDDEKAVFQKLSTTEEKEAFVEQFWLRRDPDPRTAANEFREEHYSRIVYANENFGSGDPGWLTDRGRIYILHGPPDSKESRPMGGTYARPIDEGGGVTSVHPYEKWRYRYIEGLGQDIELEFVDPTSTGAFTLAVFPWEKDALINSSMGKTLAEETGLATRRDRPALMPGAGGAGTGPESMYRRARDVPFARYEAYARVQAPPVKYKELKELVAVKVGYYSLPFQVRSHYLRLSEAQVLVPITVQIQHKDLTFKSALGAQVARMAVYGVVTNLTGKIIYEFEDEFATGFRSGDAAGGLLKSSLYQKVLPVPAGTRYKLELVLKDLASGSVGVVQHAILPPKFAAETLSSSSLILASGIQPLGSIPTGRDMFVLGDVKVMPKLDRRFTTQMPLGLYLQVYNAMLDQQTLAPSLKVMFKLSRDGKIQSMATDENGESTQFSSDLRVVLIKQLSLEGLAPGQYGVEVEVLDRLSGRSVRASETFSVVEPAATAAAQARPAP